jgi:hypothetical protein
MAVAALILGILSVVLSWIPVAGWIMCLIMGVIAIVLGALGRTRQPDKKGMAVAGMILGIIGVAFSIIWVVACGALAATGADALEEAGFDLEEITDKIKEATE